MATDLIGGGQVTRDLDRWVIGGEVEGLDAVAAELEPELKAVIGRVFKGERVDHTLQVTAVMSEVYLKLRGSPRRERFRNQEHFLAFVAQLAGRILMDHARIRFAVKRGGRQAAETLWTSLTAPEGDLPIEVLSDLRRGLDAMGEAIGEEYVQILTCHFFAGMKWHEVARAMNVSNQTVMRKLRLAKRWMRRWLEQDMVAEESSTE